MTKEAMTCCLASILHVDDDRQKRQPRVDTKQKKDMRDRWLALVLCFVVQAVRPAVLHWWQRVIRFGGILNCSDGSLVVSCTTFSVLVALKVF